MEGVTPRPAATLMAVRPGVNGPEVLMLQRPAGGAFGDLWVFPGGALEPIDETDLARRTVSVPDGTDDLAWRAAALRETVEEVGLALTDPPLAETVDAMGEAVFAYVHSRGAVLDGRHLRLLSRWVTPEGSPSRYDARFYLAVTEGSPPLLPRSTEVADLCWVTASEGLARVESGRWSMARPTRHHLHWLAAHADVDAIWRAAEKATIRQPERGGEDGASRVWLRLPVADLP